MKNSRIVVFSFLEQVCNIVKSLVFVEETGMMEENGSRSLDAGGACLPLGLEKPLGSWDDVC